MNNEKKEELLMNITQKEFRAVFDKTYDAAYHKYHNGRHDERRRLTLDGWLVLNQNKIREFEEACQDTFKYCKMYEKAYKKGCAADPTECEKKHPNEDLYEKICEIRKYFMS